VVALRIYPAWLAVTISVKIVMCSLAAVVATVDRPTSFDRIRVPGAGSNVVKSV
jgi:hypothetical protein